MVLRGGCRDAGPCYVRFCQWRGGALRLGFSYASDGADLEFALSSSTGGLR